MADEPANPEAGAVTDEASAAARIAGLLEEAEAQPEEDREEPEGQPEPEEEKASSKETEEAEPESEQEELPDTLNGFAEALGVEPDHLASHLKVNVKVNGEDREVTLADAIKGHQLESDYRLKTSELAEQRRAIEAEAAQFNERWQGEFNRLNQAIETAEGLIGGRSQEELAQLLENDPQEYLRIQAQDQALKGKLDQARQERDKMIQEQREKQHQDIARWRQSQQNILRSRMPELGDPAKLSKFESDAKTYLQGKGYNDQEISFFFSGPYDARQILVLADAARYSALQKGKSEVSKKLKGLPKVQKPGVSQDRKGEEAKLTASRDRLRRLRTKGSRQQQDAAAVDFVKGLL